MGKQFGVVLQLGCVLFALHSVDCKEFCDSEIFNASCDLSQVVVIDDAQYGRIINRPSRCVTSDYDILNCEVDALNLLDGICSGRRSCQFSVITLREFVEPCPKDVPSYLLATYSCVTVLDTTSVKCNDSIILSSSDPPHYINYVIDQTSSPSLVATPTFTTSQPSVAMTTSDTADAGVTTPFCPVIFSTQRKQRIDVTLYSFDLYNKSASARGSESYLDNLRPCQFSVYVIDEGRQHSTVLCQAHNRVQLIYSMNSSRIVVYIGPSPNASKDQVTAQEFYGNYLIKVDAVVCPDLIPHPDSWNEKYGDRIIVRCHFSSETQAITREICHRVWYIATCPSETVIVIQSAVFSRMQSSRCIDFNTTDLECYGDFQLSVESRCDGESECLLDVYRFTNQRDYIEKCTKYPRRYMHVVYKCVDEKIFRCAKFIPPENVVVEDILNGYRLSCANDKNISWEVHCIYNTWISETSISCVVKTSDSWRTKIGNSSVTKKLPIILPSVTAVLIIILAAVSVYIHKRRQRQLLNNEQDQALSMLTESVE